MSHVAQDAQMYYYAHQSIYVYSLGIHQFKYIILYFRCPQLLALMSVEQGSLCGIVRFPFAGTCDFMRVDYGSYEILTHRHPIFGMTILYHTYGIHIFLLISPWSMAVCAWH